MAQTTQKTLPQTPIGRRIPPEEYATDAQLRRQVGLCRLLKAAGLLPASYSRSFRGQVVDYILGEEMLKNPTEAWNALKDRVDEVCGETKEES